MPVMPAVTPAVEMGVTAASVVLIQVGLAGLQVLMGAGCARQLAGHSRLGRLLCKPCSTCSLGQRNISGSIYFNRPNDTSISHKRNVKAKWFPLERKTLGLGIGGLRRDKEGGMGRGRVKVSNELDAFCDFSSNVELNAELCSNEDRC